MSIRYRFALVFVLALGSWSSPSKGDDRNPCRQRACDFEIVPRVEGGRLAQGAEATEAPLVAFEHQPDGLQIRIGGQPFARYVYGTEATTRPFFESIHAPDGTQVTRNNPPIEGVDLADHPTFHPGLWLAFGDLNGADSWRNKDRIRHAGFDEPPQGGPGRGTFVVSNRYEKGGKVIGEEDCRITVLVRPTGYLLLWDSRFRPVGGDLGFGDQEEMGMGVRVATPLAVVKGGRITDSEGRVNEAEVWGQQADWCAYGGEIGGKRVGVALMPHPENFRRSWFHARDYGLLEANPFGRNAFTGGEKSRVVVRAREALRLRFGVLIHDDEPDLTGAYRDYLLQAGSPRER
ncbi:MAG TPA: PmoA family protein [Isosphaeraceae bacterium]|nr:PmoA family protein [Isosphaeraceae bacterium]